MYKTYKTSSGQRKGFTLVEILIVVIILGILAAIVIPQFSSASNDARKNSLRTQLQTLRSQLQLYAAQHVDLYPPSLVGGTGTPWAEMTVKTDFQSNTTATADLGPYLQNPPKNQLNGLVDVAVVSGLTPGTGDFGRGSQADGSPWPNSNGNVGWIFNKDNGRIWATSAKSGFIFDEDNPSADSNAQ